MQGLERERERGVLKRILLVQPLISSFKSAMKKKLGFRVWGVGFRERDVC
jgi:hypothetical protein